MMVKRYPKEKVGGSIPDREISSLLDRELVRWSTTSRALALSCWPSVSKQKKKKIRTNTLLKNPNIMCIIGAPSPTCTPIIPSTNYTIQLLEFTYCHDRFPKQARSHKHAKYNPLITTLQNNVSKANPLITITVGVRGAIHENSIEQLINHQIPKNHTKASWKNIHQNAIKYLIYLVLNKKKNLIINKTLSHYHKVVISSYHTRAHLPKEA